MPKKPQQFFFDIETGGFKGTTNPVLSVSWGEDQQEVESLFARPERGTRVSRWAEKKVWEEIKKTPGIDITSEKALMKGFLGKLEAAPGAELVGWNIGYNIAPQGQRKGTGFDIPMFISSAKRHGLEKEYAKAFGKMKIRDVGAEYALRIARGVASPIGKQLVEEGALHPALYKEAVGYMKKAGQLSAEWGIQGEGELAEALSRTGIRFSGWKQEHIFEVVTGRPPKGVHVSADDVVNMRVLAGTTPDINEDFIRRWAPGALENHLANRAKTVKMRPSEATPARYREIMKEAQEWGVAEGVEKKLRTAAFESDIPFSFVESGKGIPEKSRTFWGGAAEAIPAVRKGQFKEVLELTTPLLRKHWGKIGIGAGIAVAAAMEPGSWFSGKDDQYNVIEGLPHGGMAQRMRHTLTDFGSGYKGRGGPSSWINEPLDTGTYTEQFRSFKYQPGDIIASRNVLYDDPFHIAIVGEDKAIYQAFPDKQGKAVIYRESIEDYVEGQLKIHKAEGLDYPLYGIGRKTDLSKAQRKDIGRFVKETFESYKQGRITPAYGLRANQGINKLNCLTFASEAYRKAGVEIFKPGTNWGVPWNVDYDKFRWLTKGPERMPGAPGFSKFSMGVGIASLGLGAATLDPITAGYGLGLTAASFGMSAIAGSKPLKIGALAGFAVGPKSRAMFRKGFSGLGYAAVAAPLAYKGVGYASNFDQEDIFGAAAVAGMGYAGYKGFATLKENQFKYSEKSKRLIILADSAKGGAQGHMTPAFAVKGWVEEHGWKADVVGGLEDIGELRKNEYRAFVDAGYNAKWLSGLPGVAVQWDVQPADRAKQGHFRTHLRPWLGLQSEGMAFVTPSSANASIFARTTRQDNFYSFNTLVAKPEVINKSELLKQQLREGVLELPNISKGQKFITISGGGKGFGVPEAVKTIEKTGWLKETGHKAVVFAAHLEKHRPEAYASLMETVKKDPERFLVYDLAPGGPGRKLPEYMTGSTVNVFAAGASTTIEGVAAGKPFIGIHGGGIPAWAHFEEHPKYARERYGAIAESVKIPELADDFTEASKRMRAALESTTSATRAIPNLRPEEMDVGAKLIDIIEQGEKKGHLRPAKFRPAIQSIILPFMGSSKFKTGAAIGLSIAGVGIVGSLFSGKDDAYNTIEGLRHEGMAGDKRRELTDFGSGWRGLLNIFRSNTATLYHGAGPRAARSIRRTGLLASHAAKDNSLSSMLATTGQVQKSKLEDLVYLTANKKDASEYALVGSFIEEGMSAAAAQDRAVDLLTRKQSIFARTARREYKERTAGILKFKIPTRKQSFQEAERLNPEVPELADYPNFGTFLEAQRKRGMVPPTEDPRVLESFKLKYEGLKATKVYARDIGPQYISGRDNAYNTIEGLKHGGLAQRIRKWFTDFGSGWIRTALSKGMDLKKIASSTAKLGSGKLSPGRFQRRLLGRLKVDPEEAIRYAREVQGINVGGQRWMYGKKLGEGGFGEAWTGYRAGGKAQEGVVKTLKNMEEDPFYKLAKRLKKDPDFKFSGGVVNPILNRHITKLASSGNTAAVETPMKAVEDYMRVISGHMAEANLTPIQYEAKMTRLARKYAKDDTFVPKVFASSPEAMVMEVAGKSIDNITDMQHGGLAKFLNEKPLTDLTAKKGIVHLDPHKGNVVRRGARYAMIDYGLSMPAGANTRVMRSVVLKPIFRDYTKKMAAIPHELRTKFRPNKVDELMAELKQKPLTGKATADLGPPPREITPTVNFEPTVAKKHTSSILEQRVIKEKRKRAMQKAHRKAQVAISTNGLRSGKRHRYGTGSIVK